MLICHLHCIITLGCGYMHQGFQEVIQSLQGEVNAVQYHYHSYAVSWK